MSSRGGASARVPELARVRSRRALRTPANSTTILLMSSILRATNISKQFAGVRALREASFDVRAGEVHALVGENGAGKSTLIKVITGAVQADVGTLEFAGQALEHIDPVASRRLGIAAIYQQPALFPDLTVAENIAIGLEAGGPWRRIRWGERQARARELLARLGANISPGRF